VVLAADLDVNPNSLGVCVGIPGLSPECMVEARNAVAVMLDSALGEREVSTAIQHIEVITLPAAADKLGYIEFKEFGEYLAWKKLQQRP
jgi:hypothetical protein